MDSEHSTDTGHWRDNDAPPAVRRDIFASVVVFLVALPLCMGVAIASGMPVAAGLITGIVGGIVVGMLAGSPLQVSGPAAGLTVIVFSMVQQHGHEVLGPVVLLAGGLQILAGALRLGPWFRAVSPAVIRGMLSGIGVLIFASQFHVMVDDAPKKSGLDNLVAIPEAIRKGLPIPEWQPDEQRQFRHELLRQMSQLHETQEEIADEVHNRVSDHSTPAEAAAQAAHLEPLVVRQKQVASDLEKVVAKLDDEKLDANALPSAAARHAAAEAAHQAVVTASADLAASVESGTIEKTIDESHHVFANVRTSQSAAVASLENVMGQLRGHDWAGKIGLITIALIILWKCVPKFLQVVPAPLLAVVAVTAACTYFVLPVKTVELPARLADGVHLVSANILKDISLTVIVQGAILIAVVASAETLLCASAVDQMHNGPRTNYDRELMAQGTGNILCGIFGGLPMTGVVVRSAANVQSGATSRLSTILHGIWLLVFVAFLSGLLQLIPTACLAGLLVYTGFKLMDFRSIPELYKFGIGEVGVYLATVMTVVGVDLLTGVITGIVLSALKLLYTFSHLEMKLDVAEDRQSAELSLVGSATFFRLPALAAELEKVPRGAELHVDLEHLTYIDHACLDLLVAWARTHEATGGRLIADWSTLHATFRQGVQTPARRDGRAAEALANGNGHHSGRIESSDDEESPEPSRHAAKNRYARQSSDTR